MKLANPCKNFNSLKGEIVSLCKETYTNNGYLFPEVRDHENFIFIRDIILGDVMFINEHLDYTCYELNIREDYIKWNKIKDFKDKILSLIKNYKDREQENYE